MAVKRKALIPATLLWVWTEVTWVTTTATATAAAATAAAAAAAAAAATTVMVVTVTTVQRWGVKSAVKVNARKATVNNGWHL